MTRSILLAGGPAWIFVKAVTLLFLLAAVIQMLPAPDRQVPNYRPRPVRNAIRYTGGILAVAVLIAGGTVVASHHTALSRSRPQNPSLAAAASYVTVGMFAPGVDTWYAPEREFTAATGARVSYVLSYSAWPAAPFNTEFALLASSHGATPVIQLLPSSGVSMLQAADGTFDAQLRSYASQVRAFGRAVILSFAPEANGNWYRWGWGRTPASVWVAAWRHFVTVFREQHATNVTWLWTMNVPFSNSGPVSAYWPGAAYVGIVGIDGYFAYTTDTFTSLFRPIITQIRKLTSKPVLISETAVGPDSGAQREAQIHSLFAGVKADHLLGLIWFDEAQHDGPYHQDWRLEDDPAALAAYQAAVKEYS
jgi:Glycosyl hydrolase family 26